MNKYNFSYLIELFQWRITKRNLTEGNETIEAKHKDKLSQQRQTIEETSLGPITFNEITYMTCRQDEQWPTILG